MTAISRSCAPGGAAKRGAAKVVRNELIGDVIDPVDGTSLPQQILGSRVHAGVLLVLAVCVRARISI